MLFEDHKSTYFKGALRRMQTQANTITTQIIDLQRQKLHLERIGFKVPDNLEGGIAKALLDPRTISTMPLETLKANEWLRTAYDRGYSERPLATIMFSDIHPSVVEQMDIDMLKSEDRLRAAYERGTKDAQLSGGVMFYPRMTHTIGIPQVPHSYWIGSLPTHGAGWHAGGVQTAFQVPVFPTPPPSAQTAFATTPTAFANTPTAFANMPTAFANTPTAFANTPTAFATTPTTSATTPTASATTPNFWMPPQVPSDEMPNSNRKRTLHDQQQREHNRSPFSQAMYNRQPWITTNQQAQETEETGHRLSKMVITDKTLQRGSH